MRFGHAAIRVKDINKMLRFYVDGLGFEEAFRINNDDGSLRIVYVHISVGQYLELCLSGESRPDFDDSTSLGVRHVCFVVEDLMRTKTELEARGISFDSGVIAMKDKNSAAYLYDPEGNKIELMQINSESPQADFQRKRVLNIAENKNSQ